jgi:hypothetical protein
MTERGGISTEQLAIGYARSLRHLFPEGKKNTLEVIGMTDSKVNCYLRVFKGQMEDLFITISYIAENNRAITEKYIVPEDGKARMYNLKKGVNYSITGITIDRQTDYPIIDYEELASLYTFENTIKISSFVYQIINNAQEEPRLSHTKGPSPLLRLKWKLQDFKRRKK